MSSFNFNQFRTDCKSHLMNRLGWSEEMAHTAANIAIDVISESHGGKTYYISARKTPVDQIIADYKSGKKVADISKKYGISSQTIRKALKKSNFDKF